MLTTHTPQDSMCYCYIKVAFFFFTQIQICFHFLTYIVSHGAQHKNKEKKILVLFQVNWQLFSDLFF